MHERLEKLRGRLTGHPEQDNDAASEFKGLRLLTAQLLLLAGVDVALGVASRAPEASRPPYPHGSAGPRLSVPEAIAGWAPTLLAPLAAVAHLRHGLRPTAATASATRVLDTAVIGAGLAGLVEALVSSRRSRRLPTLTPLAMASAGLLGRIVERAERDAAEERRRLELRASLLDRFKRRRRPSVRRIVIRV